MWNDAAPAGIEPPQTCGAGKLECAAEFAVGNAAIDPRDARCGLGLVRWILLVHDVEVGVARHAVADPLHDLAGVLDQAGHHEMAHEDTAQR
jgi:hypothetical protein